MTMQRLHETQLPDDEGAIRSYTSEPLPTGLSCEVALTIADALGGTVLEFVGNVFRAIAGGKTDSAMIARVVLDDDALVGELAKVPGRLLTHGGPALIKKLLSGTKRREEDDDGRPRLYVLKNQTDFDSAYAGNLGELMRAIGWVLRVNYGPFLTGLFQAGIGPSEMPSASEDHPEGKT
jgi:hypothetical protein